MPVAEKSNRSPIATARPVAARMTNGQRRRLLRPLPGLSGVVLSSVLKVTLTGASSGITHPVGCFFRHRYGPRTGPRGLTGSSICMRAS